MNLLVIRHRKFGTNVHQIPPKLVKKNLPCQARKFSPQIWRLSLKPYSTKRASKCRSFQPLSHRHQKDRRRYFNPHLYNRWLTKPNCKNYKLKIKNLSLWINERYRERYRISLSSSNDKLIVFPGLEPNPPVRDVSRVTSLTNQTRVI